MERTTEMKVVGGVCLAYSAYVVLVSLATMAMVRHVDMPSTGELGVLGANFTLLLAIQFVLGAFGVVASLEFFRFAQWARRGLQGLAWLHMATVVAAMGAFFYFWPSQGLEGPPRFSFGLVSVVLSLLWLLPAVLVLRSLGGKSIETLFREAQA